MGGSFKLQNNRCLSSMSIISFVIILHYDSAHDDLSDSICGDLEKSLHCINFM